MTLEDYLQEISERGWYVYRLHHTGDARFNCWECSLRLEAGRDSKIASGQGPTAKIAITTAMNAMEKFPERHQKPTYTVYEGEFVADDSAGSNEAKDLLRKIISKHNPVKLKRRF